MRHCLDFYAGADLGRFAVGNEKAIADNVR